MPEKLSQGDSNLLWAYALIDGLASCGVTQAVISPGSRSTPLVIACDHHPAIQIGVQVDERCAAFFALGLAKQSQRPVILIATSGSAPAHWFPAVIEANHSTIPLILLTADRPPELHGWGANQTTDQQWLFGRHLRAFYDPGPAENETLSRDQLHKLGSTIATQAMQPHPGPIQINMPFREPLLPSNNIGLPEPATEQLNTATPISPDASVIQAIVRQIAGKPGIILCGASDLGTAFAQAVGRLADNLDCPILADPLSNVRNGVHDKRRVIAHYDAFIESAAEAITPHWVLRFGALPVSKALLQYLEKTQVPQLICDPYQQWPSLPPHGKLSVATDPVLLCEAIITMQPTPAPKAWCTAFGRLEQHTATIMTPEAVEDHPFEGEIVDTLLDCLPDRSLLFSGNSMPIRQLDSWSGVRDKQIQIAANRGVSGIDGTISTFLGMAQGDYKVAVALMGDLAFYHDMNGLLAVTNKDLVIVLINNNGGGIFGYLPQSSLGSYERYWNTATHLDFQQTATLYGLSYQLVTRQSTFRAALEQAIASGGPQLIEVMIDRDYSIKRHRHYRAAVTQQLTK
jgi:2-succinyl-5-enolpyruvyl-6-hydroxy-3-cyclohexene-1-carboxylate synthase